MMHNCSFTKPSQGQGQVHKFKPQVIKYQATNPSSNGLAEAPTLWLDRFERYLLIELIDLKGTGSIYAAPLNLEAEPLPLVS